MANCDDDLCITEDEVTKYKTIFIIVLLINLVMFFLEFFYGLISHSSALVADSADMLGDVFVYGVSLYVLKRGLEAKRKASLLKGILMTALGVGVVIESVVKIFLPVEPIGQIISMLGIVALVANAICFFLLIKHKDGDMNIKSAWICSRNDVIANIGVIVAGFLVILLNSKWPDIIIGLVISAIVLQSSIDIIRDSWKKEPNHAN